LPIIITDKTTAIYDSVAIASELNWAHKLMHIDEAWARATGKGIKIGIVDTGCDINHPDLKDAIVDCKNFSNSPGRCEDLNGHGTHVAGIVAAKVTGRGVSGIAHDASLYIAKAIDNSGVGDSNNITRAIEACTEAGCDVINLSLGSPEEYVPMSMAIKRAVDRNIIVVAAAGNSGDNNDLTIDEQWPARLPFVISVAAINKNLISAPWSSSGNNITFSAPGVDILSCYPGGRYATMSGTSQACPFITGICALMKEVKKDIGREEVVKILSQYSLSIGSKASSGAGVINVVAALDSLATIVKKGH
jgi:subtilisin family serine protease